MFSHFVAVAVSLRNEPVLILEALGSFRYDGNTFPHSLPQVLPPLVRNHANNADGEADGWRELGVADGLTGEHPDVAGPQQTHLSCLLKQVLRLLKRAVRHQHLRIHLRTERRRKTLPALL